MAWPGLGLMWLRFNDHDGFAASNGEVVYDGIGDSQ